MDNQKAKFILQSARPHGAALADPLFHEALARTRHVPELADWFAREQALDTTLSARLKEVTVPSGLRERLIVDHQEAKISVVGFNPPRHSKILLALAAAMALLATLALLLWPHPHSTSNLAAFRQEMLANVNGNIRLSHLGTDVGELTQWLAQQRNVSGMSIPAGLQNRPGIGCRTWMWKGQPVGLICFLLDSNQAVHVFVVDRATVAHLPAELRPSFTRTDGWTTAAWTEGDKLYVLAGHVDEATLAKLL